MMLSQLAEIPLLDLTGPRFLLFYVVALAAAIAWALWLRSRVLDRFDNPSGAKVELHDPYEAAFLAGGVPRCSQLAVVRLLEAGANAIECALQQEILRHGKSGMPLANVGKVINEKLSGIEARLAKLGLRPTQGESSGLGIKVVAPLVFLMLFGILKVFVGIGRDKPVVLLIVLLFITLVASLIIGAKVRRLTPSGESTLNRMRARYQAGAWDNGNDIMALSLGIALLGPSVITDYSGLFPLDDAMRNDLNKMGGTGAGNGGGSGCSSGCGGGGGSGCSSGCGGGGCGGCGGGGD